MKILFLDDEAIRFELFKKRLPPDTEVVFAQTLEECARLLTNHVNGIDYFDIIHFDHDLQDFKTNLWQASPQLAESFVSVCPPHLKPKMVVIHSVNPQGSWNLYHIFSRLTKTFTCPFRLETDEYDDALEFIQKENNAQIQENQKNVIK